MAFNDLFTGTTTRVEGRHNERAAITFDRRGREVGRFEVTFLRAPAEEPSAAVEVRLRWEDGMTPTLLHRLPWARLLLTGEAMVKVAALHEAGELDDAETERLLRKAHGFQRPKPLRAPPPDRKRPGRAGHADEHYRAVAKRYLELRTHGVANPTQAIADERNYNRNTVAGWVRRARDKGYLPAAQPGRAG